MRFAGDAGLLGGIQLGAGLIPSGAAAPPRPRGDLPDGCGLLAMLGCSAAYNLARGSSHRELLRRLDHAAIFLMDAVCWRCWVARRHTTWRGAHPIGSCCAASTTRRSS